MAVEWLEDRTLLSAVPAAALAGAISLDLPSASVTFSLGAAPAFYAIAPGAAGGLLDATVAAEGRAIRLSLLDGGGNLVVQSDGTSVTDGDPRLTEHVAGGPLYLEVQALTGPGSMPLVTTLTASLTVATDPFTSLSSQGDFSDKIAVGDFNGDGILDYASGAGVYLGAGDGSFSSEPAAPLPGLAVSDPTALAAGNFNRGGPTELAVAVGSEVTIYRGDARGAMCALDTSPVDVGDGASILAMTAIDITGAGLDDLAILVQQSSGQSEVEIWRNDGAGNFQQSTTIPVHPGAVGLTTGRFNGDASTDLALLIEGGPQAQGGVVILRGDGRGGFRPNPLIPVPGADYLLGIVAGDFSGDGRTELAISGVGIIDGAGTVTLLADGGENSFAVNVRIPVARSVNEIAAGDFNGDARTDLIVTDLDSPDVTVLLARGGGTYIDASPPDFAPLAVADVNGDGIPDEITPLGISLGVGDGSFQIPSEPLPGAGAGTSAILAAPLLLGDATPDLAVANYDRGEISILREAGDHTFRLVETIIVGGHPVALAALTEGGRTEVAVADPTAGTVTLLLNQGSGFQVGPVFRVGLRPVALAAADLDGDGNTDLAVLEQGDESSLGAVEILLANGDGTFRLGESVSVGAQPSAIAAADFNADGATDLAVTNLASGNVSVLFGQGDGTFQTAAVVDLGAGSDPVAVEAYEPGPGRPVNLVVAERGTSSIAVLTGGGDGTFRALPPIILNQAPIGLSVARFIPGLPMGLAVADRLSTDLALLAGNSDGSFVTQASYQAGAVPTGIVSGNFDADGFADLAVVNSQSNTVSILLGNGDGTFRNGETIPVGNYPYPIAAGDFNNDGRTDLAVADYVDGVQPGDVKILLGNGDGTFRAGQTIPLGVGAFSIDVADLNGDGHPDLVVADQGPSDGTGEVWVLLGNGNGTFRVDHVYQTGMLTQWVDVADLNGDGLPDIIVADQGLQDPGLGGDVMVFWGDGRGEFPTSSTLDYSHAPAANPIAVLAGDFLGTGHTDLAVLAQSNGNLTPGDVTIWGFDTTTGFHLLDRVSLSNGDDLSLYPVALAAGDFSGNGREGLAVVDYYDQVVMVLTRAPQGGLEISDKVRVGSEAESIAVADFNGDGRSDFAVTTSDPYAVSVAMSLANGQFVHAGEATVVHETVLPVDQSSGVTDLLSIDPSGNILWRRGRADSPGTFDPPLTINPGFPSRGIALVSDPRSSGRWVVSIDLNDDALSIYAFRGGTYQRIGSLTTGAYPAEVLAADLTGDGYTDLVVRNAGDDTASVDFGRGDGSFVPGPVVPLGPNVSDLALVVLDGSGVPDLVATDAATGQVTILQNDGHGDFGDPRVYRAGTGPSVVSTAADGTGAEVTSSDQTAGVAVAMLSGSANPSLVTIGPGGLSLAILAGLGDDRFANPVPMALGMSFQVVRTFAPHAGGTGSDVAALGPDGLAVFNDNGAGGLYLRATYDVGPDATGLAVADLNDDGATDLLVSNKYGDVLVLNGDGTGAFQPFVNSNQQTYLTVYGRALNRQPVFVFSAQGLGRASVEIGAGSPVPLPVGPQPLSHPGQVTAADLAGTGIPDLILVNSGGNSVMVYPGLGNGRFGAPDIFPVGDDPVGIAVADVNGDGTPDLVVANHGSNDLSVLVGAVGGMVWSPSSSLRLKAGFGPTAVAVADVLGGPALDIVVTDGLSNDVRVIRGVGGGFFDDSNPLILPTGSDPVGVVVLPPVGSSHAGLVTLNAGSNDLTFIGAPGAAASLLRTYSSGGDLPIAAVATSDPLTGVERILVANSADGRLALFQVTPDGLDLLETFLAPGLAHPTALAVDGFGEVFGVNEATERAVLVALGFGLRGSDANGVFDPLAGGNAAGGLEEQLVVRLESLGGVALGASLSSILVEATGEAGEAGTDIVALAVPGAIPQPPGATTTARYGDNGDTLDSAKQSDELMAAAQATVDRRLPDELVEMLLGQDGVDDIRRQFVGDLLRDAIPPSLAPPGTRLEPRPSSTPVRPAIQPASEKSGMLDTNPSRICRSACAANGSQVVEASAIESEGSAPSTRFWIAHPPWALLAATLSTALSQLMTEFPRRRSHRHGSSEVEG
jgi:hypothetical protein